MEGLERVCVTQIYITITKDLRKSIQKKKGSLWLMLLKISFHGQLAPVALGHRTHVAEEAKDRKDK